MAIVLFESTDYTVLAIKGGGIVLRRKNPLPELELFFQPGDDAQSVRDYISALDEVPDAKRQTMFDIACSQYF